MKKNKNNELDLIVFLKQFQILSRKQQNDIINELEKQKNDKSKSV